MSNNGPRPWWASLLTSALTALIGLATVIVAVLLVRPVMPDSDLWIWLVIGGASAAGVGGSLGRAVLGRSPPDQRGYARGDVLVTAGALALALLAVALLAASAGGCLAREVRAERSVEFEVSRGPPCIVTVRADGDLVHTTRGETVRCAVEIDGAVRP